MPTQPTLASSLTISEYNHPFVWPLMGQLHRQHVGRVYHWLIEQSIVNGEILSVE